jgi:putative toxin-antitoxin system antitoxin component (TIGR02293 family)
MKRASKPDREVQIPKKEQSSGRRPSKKTAVPEATDEENNIKETTENRIPWLRNEKSISLEGKFEDIEGLPNIVKKALKGVSPEIFYSFATLIDMPDRYLAAMINTSARTLSNYKEQKKNLEPVKGEHLLKLIALFKKGEEIFGTLYEFHGWLFKPQLHATEVPIDWLVTPGGVDLVSQELDRVAYGYAL